MKKFVVLDNGGGSPLSEPEKFGESFCVFNNRIDAWNHLIQMNNGRDSRVAEIEIKIVAESGENE